MIHLISQYGMNVHFILLQKGKHIMLITHKIDHLFYASGYYFRGQREWIQ